MPHAERHLANIDVLKREAFKHQNSSCRVMTGRGRPMGTHQSGSLADAALPMTSVLYQGRDALQQTARRTRGAPCAAALLHGRQRVFGRWRDVALEPPLASRLQRRFSIS